MQLVQNKDNNNDNKKKRNALNLRTKLPPTAASSRDLPEWCIVPAGLRCSLNSAFRTWCKKPAFYARCPNCVQNAL